MMKALAANHERLEEEARLKRKAGNMGAALKETQAVQNSLQRREEEVKNYLQEVGLEKIKTGADGNCFFYAVQGYGDIKGIYDMSVSIDALREAVSETIQTKKDLYLPSFVSIAELQAHVRDIRKCEERGDTTNTWADEVDVAAFSDHFNVCIVIHDWRKTNNTPYHIAQISYPNNCDVGGYPNPNRIHILRTNMNHYSLLMPIDDPEYNVLKLFVENIYLPLDLDIIKAHQKQLEQMASQAAVNLSRVRLNQPTTSAAASSSPRPLHTNARNAAIHLSGIGLSQSSKSSALNSAPLFNITLTPEELAQQLAILENARKRAAQAASKSMSGKSAASAIPLNGTNMPWTCSECTFENKPNVSSCAMCGAQRQASTNTSRLPGASAASAIPLNGLRGKSAASAIPRNGTNMPAQAAASSSSAVPSVVQQLVSNASRNLSGVHLNQQSELHQQIAKLQQQIPILETQIAKLLKSDPKGEPYKKAEALLKKQKDQLEKRLDILSKKGGTRKRRTHKRRTHKRRTHKRRTHKKQNKNNRKSHRKVRK